MKSTSFYFLYLACRNVSAENFEIHTFTNIKKQIDAVIDYRDFLDKKKYQFHYDEILSIEDKNYFLRKDKYSFFNTYYMKKRFMIKMWRKLIDKFLPSSNKIEQIKRGIRGYSTIEMQLLRTLAIKEGYDCVIRRKIYEILYSKLFLASLKNYYKKCDCDVSYFKEYMLYLYMNVAPCLIKGGKAHFESKLEVNVKELGSFTKEQLFILTLTFSGKIKKQDIFDIYSVEISSLELDLEECVCLKECLFKS